LLYSSCTPSEPSELAAVFVSLPADIGLDFLPLPKPGGDVGRIEELPPELLASAAEDEPVIQGRGGFVLQGTVAPAAERWVL